MIMLAKVYTLQCYTNEQLNRLHFNYFIIH